MKCESCGADNPDGKRFCGDCGKELKEVPVGTDDGSSRKCTACGRTLQEETNVCPYCGHWVKRSMF